MRYRPEIDGLRALAVIVVVLFHARTPGFSGGFVGVDVFFVISGYLITSLIVSDLKQGRFSLLGFWERRARRILPALTALVLVSLAIGCWVLAPKDLQRLAQQAFAQSIFASNFLFWQQSGYFGATADSIPLLHTWSLAVEEQFYLLFPLLLAFLARFRLRVMAGVLLAVGLVSFAGSAWAVMNGAERAAFFLLPTRAWELFTGALLALQPDRLRTRLNDGKDQLLCALGLAAIAVAVFTFDRSTPFPGTTALLPVGGTAAIIYASAPGRTSIGRLLAHPRLVFLGLISYSLYLWHWPLLVFARYLNHGTAPSATCTVAVIGFSVAIAYGSWRFVETPFRQRRLLVSRKLMLGAAGTALAMMAALGLAGHLGDGFPGRLPVAAANYAAAAKDGNPHRSKCHSLPVESVRANRVCKLGPAGAPPGLISWGDSHADAMMPLFEWFALESSVPVWHASSSSCPPILGVMRARRSLCYDFNQAMLALVSRSGVKHVVLTARWANYVEGREPAGVEASEPPDYLQDAQTRSLDRKSSKAVFSRQLEPTIDALLDIGVHVWLVRQVPEQRFNVPERLATETWKGGDPTMVGRPESDYIRRQQFVDAQFANVIGPRVHLLDPASMLCAGGFCRVEIDGHSLYRDDDHVSSFGAIWLTPAFAPLFGAVTERQWVAPRAPP